MKSVKLDGKAIHPTKIVCIGRNYVDHIRELGNDIPAEMVFFIKPNSAIAESIQFGKRDEIHYEAEISFVVMGGKLAAVGLGLDLTKRETQTRLKARGLPWERAKAFDGAAVFGEFVAFTGNITDLRLQLYINDALVQDGGYAMMINKPDEILREAASFLSFEDGDLIMTGTPKGVGRINRGDRFEGKIFENEKLIVAANWVVQ